MPESLSIVIVEYDQTDTVDCESSERQMCAAHFACIHADFTCKKCINIFPNTLLIFCDLCEKNRISCDFRVRSKEKTLIF